MNVKMSAKRVPITDELRSYAEERAERFGRYFDRAHDVEVFLGRDGDDYTAEMVVHATRGQMIVGHAKDRGLHAAIDMATDKVDRQLTKVKERIRGRRARGAGQRSPGEGETSPAETAEPGSGEEAVL
ncbi:MAG: ribosome-associated translation inhibitor RaiA [Planctomycetes bacterium]|nr:ribosome-associated translation inhibitor RaiA [Planctomycetota bacterium]